MNPDEKATPSKPSTAKQKTKFNFAIQLVIVVGIVVVLNAFSSSIFRRFDLTDDSRHTLSEVSESYLDTLPEQAYVTIYYGGELPTHYKQFEDGMRTLLEELTISSNGHLDYQFVDPGEDQGFEGLGFGHRILPRMHSQSLNWAGSTATNFTMKKASASMSWQA